MTDCEYCADCGGQLDGFDQCWSCDTYGTPAEQKADREKTEEARSRYPEMADFDARLKSDKPGLPCCQLDGACTGGSSCWHDEPDNIPEGW